MSLTVDADTVALYKFNQAARPPTTNYSTVADSVGAHDLAEITAGSGASGNYTHIVNGPRGEGYGLGSRRYARFFPGVLGGARFRCDISGDSAAQDVFRSTYTLDCWVRPVANAGSTRKIFAVQGLAPAGSSSAENKLIALYITWDGRVQFSWEHDGRVQVIQQTAAGRAPDDEWTYVWMVVDLSGGTASVSIRCKTIGSAATLDSFSGLTKPNHGENALINFSHQGDDVSSGGWNSPMLGAVKSFRVSNIARTAGDFDLNSDPTEHDCLTPIDGSTFALWYFDDEPDAIEETDYGYHARLVAGDFDIVDQLAVDGGKARHFDGATEYDAHAGYEPFRDMLETQDYTFEAMFRGESGYSGADRGFWCYGLTGSGASADNFVAMDLLGTSRYLQWKQEHGSSSTTTSVYSTSTTPLLAALVDGYDRHYLAGVRWWNGSSWTYEIYLDAVLVASGTTALGFDGGASSWLRLATGALAADGWLGTLDEMRWTKRRMLSTEIEDNYDALLDVTPTPPDVASVTTGLPKIEARIRVPEAGWPISVTDADGTNTRTIPAGDYYPNSVAPGGTRSFASQLAATLSAGAVTYTVTYDDDTDDASGRVTIAADGTFSISWSNAIVRDCLGFDGAGTSAATSATGSLHALYLWLPNGQRIPDEPDPPAGEDTHDFGTPEWDYKPTFAPSGASTQSTFNERWRARFMFDPLLGHKCKASVEQIENESLETLLRTIMAAGGCPWRYHNHRQDDDTYWTQVFDEDIATFNPQNTVPGWVGELSHYHAEWRARKYIPLLTDGVLE